MNAYPREQPFPRARAVSIEASTGPTNPALASLRTYQLPPYRGAERMMRSYLSEYERMSSGAAIGIRGAFGSGKTHLIHFLMESVRAAQADLGPGHMPVQVYAKATSGDFFEIYRGLISALGAQQLAQAHVKVLSAAGRRLAKGSELFETSIPQTDTPTAVEQLRYTPEMVLGLIRDTLLSESAIVENVAAELRGESSRFTELFSAFTFLNDPALQGTAFSWFQGAPINSEDLKRLGVSAPLTVADANRGLQFISMMYSFAHVPFIIYIDQIERLVLDDVDRREANRGYLHSLIEALVSNRNMLVVAGVSEAWDQLKPDFVQRLSLPPVMMPSLDAKQAQAIIAVWLADDPKNFKESQIFPFSKDSISEIVKLSRGNLRSIISLCFNCFQLARPKELRISLAIVRKAAQSLEALYSRATVLEEIERYLRASRFSFERRATVAGDSQDIVVPNSSAPRVVINVMEPIFLEDEARDAHMHAASAQKLRVEFPKIEYVLVDVGYRSGEVEEILRPPLIDFYVRYDPERFRGEFDGILEAIRNPIDSSDLKQVALENTEINQSIRQLQDLVVARTDQQARIDERIAEMLKSIGSPVINVQNTTEREPTFRTLMSWRYLPIIGVALLGFLFIALFFPFFIQNEQNQIARLQTAVERSIQYVDKGTAEPLRLAHNEIDSFLSK